MTRESLWRPACCSVLIKRQVCKCLVKKISRQVGNRTSGSGTEVAQPLKRFIRQIQIQAPWKKRRIQNEIGISQKRGAFHTTLPQPAATCRRLRQRSRLLIRHGRLQEEGRKVAQRTALRTAALHEVLPCPLRHRHTDAPRRSSRVNPGRRPAVTVLGRVLRRGAHTANCAPPMTNQFSVIAI